MADKHNTTAGNIIRSAMANAEQLERFNKAFQKHINEQDLIKQTGLLPEEQSA